jgi:hypothetical protein
MASGVAGLTGLRTTLAVIMARGLAAAGCALVTTAAFGQTTAAALPPPPPADNDDDPLRAGPGLPGVGGFPGRGLALGASLMSRYESNLGRTVIADAGYRLRPQVNLDYGLGMGQQGLFVSALAARDVFYDVSTRQRNAERLRLAGGVQYRLSRCSGTAGAGWTRALALQSDATAFGGFNRTQTSFGINATCRVSGALSLLGSVVRSSSQIERGSSQAFNVDAWAYSAGLAFGSANLGQFSLNASQTDSQFDGRLVLTPTGFVEDSLRQRNIRFGYERPFGNRISLSAGVSYLQTDPGTDEQVVLIDNVLQIVPRDSFSGVGYDVGLDVALGPRMKLDVTASRSAFANALVGAQFTIVNAYAIGFNYELTPRYSLQLGASRRNNRYRGSFVSQFDPVRRESDELDRFFAQVRGKLGSRLNLSLDVTHNRRRSNPSILNFSSTGVGLNLSFQLGRR